MKTLPTRFLRHILPKRRGYDGIRAIVESVLEPEGMYNLVERQTDIGLHGWAPEAFEECLTGQEILDTLPIICSHHQRGCARVMGNYRIRMTPRKIKINYHLPGVDTYYLRSVDIISVN